MTKLSQKRKIVNHSQYFSPTDFIQNFNHTKGTEEMGFVLSRAFEQVREEQNANLSQFTQDHQLVKQEIKQEITEVKESVVTKEYLDEKLKHLDDKFKHIDEKFKHVDDKLEHFATKEYVHIEISKAKWQTIGTIIVVFIIPIIARHFGFNL